MKFILHLRDLPLAWTDLDFRRIEHYQLLHPTESMQSLSEFLSKPFDFNPSKRSFSLKWAIGFVLIAAAARILPHPVNFTPLGAMALFGAASISRKWLAVALPIVAFWISDLFLNNVVYSMYYEGFTWFTPGYLWMYGAMILTSLIGFGLLGKVSIHRLAGASISSSIVFFLLSNFGVWLGSTLYPQTLTGLGACYVAGLAFLQNSLAGDLFFSAALFGGYAILINRMQTDLEEKAEKVDVRSDF